MRILESLINFYFLVFLTVLPLTYIASTVLFFIKNKRESDEDKDKLNTKNKICISLFVLLNAVFFAIITLFVLCYDAIVNLIGSTAYYFICFSLVILIYLIISIIESIASDPQKYMKVMSKNLALCEYKDFIIRSSITQFIKNYIFISYIVAIFLFQLESMNLYEFNNGFVRVIGEVCNNTITIILAFELILNYKDHKRKEFDGVNKGTQLFNVFFDFSMKYLKLYKVLIDKFKAILYEKDKNFYSELTKLNSTLKIELSNIREEKEYNTIKLSSKIKTYDIAFDTITECIENYLEDKEKTNNKKEYIIYLCEYFQYIIKNDVVIKTRVQYLKRVCKFANNRRKIINKAR